MKWLAAGAVVIVAGVAAWLALRPTDPPLEYGAPGFPARGELIGDEELVEDAAQAWRRAFNPPEETIRALWAGRIGDERKVVLLSGGRTTTVEIDADGEVGFYRTEAVSEGSPIVLARDGIVVTGGAPERWTETSADGPAGRPPGNSTYSGEVRAKDGFVPYDDDEAFIALAPIGEGAGDLVPVLVGAHDGTPWPAVVESGDWPRVRQQITQDVISKHAASALAAAAAKLTGPGDQIPVVRLLPSVALPGFQVAYAAVGRSIDEGISIALASEVDDEPAVDVLGRSDDEPALAAKAFGDGFVVVGTPGIARIEIRTGGRTERRRGSFAYLPGVSEADVSGITRDGDRVAAVTDD